MGGDALRFRSARYRSSSAWRRWMSGSVMAADRGCGRFTVDRKFRAWPEIFISGSKLRCRRQGRPRALCCRQQEVPACRERRSGIVRQRGEFRAGPKHRRVWLCFFAVDRRLSDGCRPGLPVPSAAEGMDFGRYSPIIPIAESPCTGFPEARFGRSDPGLEARPA
jgi:hypothetical protein